MKTSTLTPLVVSYLAAAAAQSVFCQDTIYTSRSAFESALSSSTTVTFENLPVTPVGGTGLDTVSASGIMIGTGYLFVRGAFSPTPDSGKYVRHFDASYPVTIVLPNGVTAIGGDFSGGIPPFTSYVATLTANLVGGQSYVYNFSGQRDFWSFFGVTFPQPIASVVFDDGGTFLPGTHNEMLDNVTFGTIPEPGSFGLLALGGLLVASRIRKSRP